MRINMFKLYSKRCEQAIRVLIAGKLCMDDSSLQAFQAPEVSEKAEISIDLARKALYELSQAGVLRSLRGPDGGYVFETPIDELTLLDIVHAIDGDDAYDSCVLGLPECSDKNPCPIHKRWIRAKAQLLAELEKTTFKSMCTNATRS